MLSEPNTVDSINELMCSVQEYMAIHFRVWLESYIKNLESYIKNIEATISNDSYEDGYSDAISAAIDVLNTL